MQELTVCVGRVCRSKQGRDKGRYFIIREAADGDYVYLVDGAFRKMDRPKKKKLKHLELRPFVLESVAIKLQEGMKVFDAEINSALRAVQEDI